MLTFQELILRLERFWADNGCIIWQPFSEKVGAGTMNPATVLRVLGPDAWNVAYVEPSFRPDDGRFGENPNRMQMHTQYQVILKPDPGDPQERYLDSLEALGLDRKQHDIRFVEDNWESPALGAWGLGWEVWLDGMEITQFTYFQQAGGMPLEPVAVEITYGLERIAMYLQDVDEVWKLKWNDDITYAEILKHQEVDYCQYAFNFANVDRLQQMYTLFAAEAKAALDRDLVVPAHDYVLRCSHTFNLLDTRGAIGVTERARYFGEMRDLARQVAEGFLKQKGVDEVTVAQPSPREPVTGADAADVLTAEFVLEIGTEEMPAAQVPQAMDQLRSGLNTCIEDAGLTFDGLEVGGTPRRLVATIRGMLGRQADEERTARGPAAKAAYDDEGNATKALEGFCRGQGVDPADVETRPDEKGVDYVYAQKRVEGRATVDVLAERLPDVIASIGFTRSMRWASDGIAFTRPIRWIVALFGGDVVPFTYANVRSGRTTRGLRPDHAPEVDVDDASSFGKTLAGLKVQIDREARKTSIRGQVRRLADEVGGRVPDDPDLLEEVTDLVEAPFALRGSFDVSHLSLPQEVLVTVMRKHQRYFPLIDEAGALLPHFITVSNGEPQTPDLVVKGNENVIRARYADAAFFYREDTGHELDDFLHKLHTLTFQEDLGSMLDKVHRIGQTVDALSGDLALEGDAREDALRAARLCKADLATKLVVEMTSLQGVMGRYYALASGESEAVAQAIEEHYRPRFPGDPAPASPVGFALSVADRLDSLAGLFCAGVRPRATADPYGLRRDAIGLLTCLIDKSHSFSLKKGLATAGKSLPVDADPTALEEALDFILRRLEVQLRDEGFAFDVVTAAIEGGSDDPYEIRRTVDGLSRMVASDGWDDTFNAYARCKRIVRDLDERFPLAPDDDGEPASRALHEAYTRVSEAGKTNGRSIDHLASALESLREPITTFFDDVLVMAEDEKEKRSRLGLVQHIASLPDGVADLSRLEGF